MNFYAIHLYGSIGAGLEMPMEAQLTSVGFPSRQIRLGDTPPRRHPKCKLAPGSFIQPISIDSSGAAIRRLATTSLEIEKESHYEY
jgi:hypothetical protein